MKVNQLYERFLLAVSFMNSYTDPLPADLLLKLYAYYKRANKNLEHPGSKTPLINAFKANAMVQAQDIDPEEAMLRYIELVDQEVRSIESSSLLRKTR